MLPWRWRRTNDTRDVAYSSNHRIAGEKSAINAGSPGNRHRQVGIGAECPNSWRLASSHTTCLGAPPLQPPSPETSRTFVMDFAASSILLSDVIFVSALNCIDLFTCGCRRWKRVVFSNSRLDSMTRGVLVESIAENVVGRYGKKIGNSSGFHNRESGFKSGKASLFHEVRSVLKTFQIEQWKNSKDTVC